ncbi:MAG TPA: crossover junction endodeoxyribonuclease RuvC [bacterium]|nr:crossover junction endodeoxyribonuclease RuvC [bacterium]HPN31696.1 crossover junction endodeoxyribonuclease RuvC [bacterium]
MSSNKDLLRIIGIDPGLGITGYGIIDADFRKPLLREAGCIRIPKNQSFEKRLKYLYDEINNLIKSFLPDVMVVEELYSHYNHPKTSIIMGHARGVIFLAAAVNGLNVKSFSANKIKMSLTGNGHSSKLQIQNMIKNRFSLDKLPEPPDVADAIAAALCYCNTLNY